MIIYAESYYGLSFEEYIESVLNRVRVKSMHLPPLKAVKISQEGSLSARVNHGRWIVDCPVCKGAEYVFKSRLLMLCQNCRNDSTDEFRQVVLPQEVDEIEAALCKRPEQSYAFGRRCYPHRNWEVGQTVADLERENKEHGVN